MHDHGHKLPSQKSPCLQIMFNINSKNCVNNNIITDMNKNFHLDLNPNDGANKIDKTVIMSNKKYSHYSNQKSSKPSVNKISLNSSKPTDFISQQNSKSNKKSFKTNKANISINQTQKSMKNSNLQKNISGNFTKSNHNQQKNLISQRKSKKSKHNIEKNKIMRQKIIQLMIKDYQNGKISANNLKVAISSLIEKQANENKSKIKSHSKTQKSRIHLPNSYKSSLTNSFRNIPKNIPAKSKSQKMYQHSFIKLGKKNEQFDQQPQIIERVIDHKDFVSKIIIKGINSSLFLSNQWTATNDSPTKKDSIVNVNVINTSDSVKDLRKQMQKISIKTNQQNSKVDINNEYNFQNPKQSFNDQIHNSQTQNILDFYISQFQNLQNKKNSQFYSNFYSQEELTKMQMQGMDNLQSQQENKMNDVDLQSCNFEQYELRQLSSIGGQQQQQQIKQQQIYANKEKEISVNNLSNANKNHVQKLQSFQQSSILKSYVSSQIKNNQKKFVYSTSKKQQLTQKRVKSITQNQIKRLNQVLQVIKNQLNINVNQQNLQKKQKNQQQILSNLMHLIEKQKDKASQQLKLYQLFDDKKDFVQKKQQQKQRQEIGEKIDHNQIINSFKKKLVNKKTFLNNQNNQEPKIITNNKVYFDSHDLKSNKSDKSLTSSLSLSSTNHRNLSKTKISQLNFDEIEIGLFKRLHDIETKRQKQISIITEKFINDKISPKQYHEQKQIIMKWFLIQANKLKKTRKYLQQGYKKARNVILKDKDEGIINYQTNLTRQKSSKMIKCISEKYLGNRQVINQEIVQTKQQQKQQILLSKVKVDNDDEYRKHYTTIDLTQLSSRQRVMDEKDRRQYNNVVVQQQYRDCLSGSSQQIQQQKLQQQQQQEQELSHQYEISKSRLANVYRQQQQWQNYYDGYMDQQQQDEKQGDQYKQQDQYQQQQQLQMQQIHLIQPQQIISVTSFNNNNDDEIIPYIQQHHQQPNQDNNQQDNDNGQQIDQYHAQDQQQSNVYIQQLQNCYYEYKQQQKNYDEIIVQYSNQQQQQQYQHQHQDLLINSQSQSQNINITLNKRSQTKTTNNKNNINKFKQQHNHQQLFSPKKLPIHYEQQNHQRQQQFSSQLQHYNLLNKSSLQQHLQQSSSLTSSHQKQNTRFNPNFKKFKFLSDQDKDDIFQFIFLDLCLQILLDQSRNSKITKSIEKYVAYLKKKKYISKGFKTGLDVCKTYVNHIQTYLINNYFPTLKRLQSPIGPSAKQMLKFMRQYQEISQQQSLSSSSNNDSVGLVLPIEVYQKFQLQPINLLKVERYYDDDQRETGRMKFLNSLKRFHTKALFDSLNQMLDLERNYGIWGKPFPWKKTLSADRKLTNTQLKQKLKKSSQKVIQNCSYLCGVLLDKQDSVFGKAKISEQYLYHIREDRMSKMLSNDMLDNQQRWIFYDDQQVEVLMALTKSVISSVFYQAIRDIHAVVNRGFA